MFKMLSFRLYLIINTKDIQVVHELLGSPSYQSTLDVKLNARTITLAFILLELFPFELCHKIVYALSLN